MILGLIGLVTVLAPAWAQVNDGSSEFSSPCAGEVWNVPGGPSAVLRGGAE